MWNRTFYLVGWIFAFLWHIAKKIPFLIRVILWFIFSRKKANFSFDGLSIWTFTYLLFILIPIMYQVPSIRSKWKQRANLLTKAILGWSFNCHFRIAGWLFDLLISKFHSIYWLLRGWMNASFYFSSYSTPTQTPIRSSYSHAHKCWWCGFFSIVQGWVIICSFAKVLFQGYRVFRLKTVRKKWL